MRAVHFGAGNIGRGFIGLLLRESGYDVTFVEANAEVVRLMNELGSYPVYVAGRDGRREERWVRGVRAVHAGDAEAVARLVHEADVVTTAVGKAALPMIAPAIAAGIARRSREGLAVIVVACENVLGNSAYLEGHVRAAARDADELPGRAAFPNCVVDRIVPNAAKRPGDHPLAVTVEEYAHWAIDAEGLAVRPPIAGAEFRDGLDAVLGQKLFTLNMAHAVIGFYGHLSGYRFVHEAMGDERVRALLDGALREAGQALTGLYGIDADAQARYAARTVERLENPALQDEIVRVSRDPLRKLGAQDRLVRPALAAAESGVVPAHLATGVAAALLYDEPTDAESVRLSERVRSHGIRNALATASGVPETHVLAELVHANARFRAL